MKKLLVTSLLLAPSVTFSASFVVQNIEVNGIRQDMKPKFMANLPVKVGSKLTEKDMSQLVRTLYLKGYDTPSAERQGNTLKISIQPQLTINRISIDGNNSIPTDAIKNNLKSSGFSQGDILNRQKLRVFCEEMEAYFKTVGRYNATVKSEITTLDGDRVDVKLIIDEASKAKLVSLTIKGNNAFSTGRLEDEMSLSPTAWWKLFGGAFEQEKFNKDLEALHNFYLNNGYAKMQIVGTDVLLNDEKTQVNVMISIDEGKEYRVTDARIVGDLGGVLPKEFDSALEEIKLGKTYRLSDVQKAENEIKTILGNQGFGDPKVQVNVDFDDKKATMVITFVLEPGKRFTVRKIRFEGNIVSADSTLRQEMRQQEGTWLSSQLVQMGKMRLDRTGFFEGVEVETVSVPDTDDQLDILYKVRERNTGSINFGIGYGTESGFSYNVGVAQDNFLGMGSSISIQGAHNDYGNNISLSYNEPYFTRDGIGLGGSIFYDNYNNSKNDHASTYSKKSYGINGTLSFPVNENNAYYLGLGIVKNRLGEMVPEYHRWLYKESMGYNSWKFDSLDYTFSLGWNYNSLDRGYFPTEGVKATIGGKILFPNSDNKYYSLDLETQGYYPLDRNHAWILAGKLTLNFANGFGGRRLPFYQYYSAGGIGSLRGFAYGGVGPTAIYSDDPLNCPADVSNDVGGYNFCSVSSDIMGGNAMALASVELIFPTPFVADKNQSNVRTSIFVDAGSVWSTHWKKDGKPYPTLPDYGNPSRVRVSAGVGFQWYSPIGLLQFSYAKPIKKYESDDIEQFQFTVGSSF